MALSSLEINYIGALFHDIGKLVWRSYDVRSGEDHEKLGEQFIREYLGKVNCLKEDIEEIINAASRRRGKIWKADIIAAEERQESEKEAPRVYLEAITNRVDLGISELKNKSDKYWFYLPKPLSLNKEDNFPINSEKYFNDFVLNETEYQNYHRQLLNSLINDVSKLKDESDFKSLSRTLIKLLEKYTSKVLSAGYLSHPDISLFDHSRLTAALSICYELGDENKECLLLKGDISGIQSYIYGGIRDMVDIAKRLRGRSFTIQLLTDVISNFILEKLNLFEANLLYNGGGHFLMLAPANEKNKKILKEISREINLSLLNEYSGRISLIWDYIECSGNEFIGDFRNIYRKLDEKLNTNKKLKFRDSLGELFSLNLIAKEFRSNEEKIETLEKNLGEKLPKLKYLLISKHEINPRSNDDYFEIKFKDFNTFIYLCKDVNCVENLIANADYKNDLRIISINDTNVIDSFNRNVFLNVSKEFRFLGNHVPTENNRILSFDELAENNSKNYPLLGMMRMDVDNLGAIFSFGLKETSDKEKKYTPSRIANLSRELSWFFTGYINEIAKKHQIYIAYSGGDDVFVVGNWFELIKFVKELRKELKQFVCHNDHLSASAGIIFTKPNFPISQSALLAGEQENLAKKTKYRLEKNKLGVFDIQLEWKEFEEFVEYAYRLINFLESEDGKKVIPRSFLHYLFSVTNAVFDSQGKLNLRKFVKAVNILHYMFARRKVNYSVIENENKRSQVNQWLYELAIKLLLSKDKESTFRKIKFPLTLVLYKTRR